MRRPWLSLSWAACRGSVVKAQKVTVCHSHVAQACLARGRRGVSGMISRGTRQIGHEEVRGKSNKRIGDAGVDPSDMGSALAHRRCVHVAGDKKCTRHNKRGVGTFPEAGRSAREVLQRPPIVCSGQCPMQGRIQRFQVELDCAARSQSWLCCSLHGQRMDRPASLPVPCGRDT